MQGRMRVGLILSLVLVLLVSESFAAPSVVDAPEVTETPQADGENKSSDDKEDLQLQLAGKSDDDDDEPEINHQEVAKEFGLTGTDLEQLYNTWVPTVPDGEESSFQTFLEWMEENDEPEDEGAVGPGTHYLKSIIKWTGKIRNKANKKAKGQRSIDEEQPQMDRSQIAAEFGLNETDLEDLYKLWVTKVPAGVDSSFPEFLIWMEENDEPEDEGAVGPETHGPITTTVKWVFRIVNGVRKGYKEFVENNKPKRPRSIDGEEAQMDSNEIAAADLKRLRRGRKLRKAGRRRSGLTHFPITTFWIPRRRSLSELDENQPQQSIVNGQKSMAARDLQPSFKPGPQSPSSEEVELSKENAEDESLGVGAAAYVGQNLFDAYRKWLKTVGEGKDRSFQKFAELFNIRKPRSLESELSDESKLPDTEKPDGVETEKKVPEGEEKEKEVPVDESKPNDTNGGYSCEKNSPCNIENIVNEQFYFATTSNDKFIQCDAWGGCHTLICDDGLVWDDQIKTCGLRT